MMTREEAIKFAEHAVSMTDIPEVKEFYRMSAAALRPVSREQVEKVWRGEWKMVSNGKGICSKCHRQDDIDQLAKFCRYCGAAMTDKAVQMVFERLEALKDDKDV